MEDMTQLTKKFPAADPSVYVDDPTCDTAQDTFEEVLDVLVPYSLEFARRMAKKKLTLSAKGLICCNSVARAKILAVELSQYFLIYQALSHLQYTSGSLWTDTGHIMLWHKRQLRPHDTFRGMLPENDKTKR